MIEEICSIKINIEIFPSLRFTLKCYELSKFSGDFVRLGLWSYDGNISKT